MKFKEWFSSRGPYFVRQRTIRVIRRYNLFPQRAKFRIQSCVEDLGKLGCLPTFPTPGIIVRRYPRFFHDLQEMGVEVAVHGYQHIDLKTYSTVEAQAQLIRAKHIFQVNQIDVHGFRCPYLGFNDDLLFSLPKGLFEYSSNKTIDWNVVSRYRDGRVNPIFETLRGFYRAQPSSDFVSVPWSYPNMIELPISVPDDLQLLDGLNFSPDDIANVWIQILYLTHQRGKLFNLIFHPELATLIGSAFYNVLSQAKSLFPVVWIARLCDISNWWVEKNNFKVKISDSSTGLVIEFSCSPRATILLKGLEINKDIQTWDGQYQLFEGRRIEVHATPRPFIGIDTGVPENVSSFLKEQGYILDMSAAASKCGVFLNNTVLASINNNVQLINYIEEKNEPLIRYWRWPSGAKSVMSITGDLDALSLMDYLSRLYDS